MTLNLFLELNQTTVRLICVTADYSRKYANEKVVLAYRRAPTYAMGGFSVVVFACTGGLCAVCRRETTITRGVTPRAAADELLRCFVSLVRSAGIKQE